MSLVLESCTLEESCTVLGKSEELLVELRDQLQEWLRLQPHLPQDATPHFLENVLLGTKMSLEQAKHKLDMFYTMRRLAPEIMTDQDPRFPIFDRVHELVPIVCLPKLTPRKERVFIVQPRSGDYSKITGFDVIKYALMVEEILLVESRSQGSIYVHDHASLSVGFIALFTPMVLKKGEKVSVESFARRIAGIHFINTVSVTQTLISFVKKVVKPKLAARIHSHSKRSYDSFYEYVPKSMLPKDYGGDEPSMSDLAESLRQKVYRKRDWFIEQEKNLVNESLRPGPSINADDLFGISGSFRKLELD